MAEVTKISTHLADAKNRLLEQYRDSENLPNFHAIFEIFVQRFQDLENTLENYIDDKSIYTAIGVQLDNIGNLVNIRRIYGQSDASYRSDIFLKIFQNTSSGTKEEVINFLKQSTPATEIEVRNLYNATVQIFLNTNLNPTNDADIADYYTNAIFNNLPAGVGIDSIVAVQADSFSMGTIGDSDSAILGLSSEATSSTDGGKLSTILNGNGL
jgi:hypothetical protein